MNQQNVSRNASLKSFPRLHSSNIQDTNSNDEDYCDVARVVRPSTSDHYRDTNYSNNRGSSTSFCETDPLIPSRTKATNTYRNNSDNKYVDPPGSGFVKFIGNLVGCFSVFCCCGKTKKSVYATVPQGYQGLVLEFNQLKQIVGPGTYYINPMSEEMQLCSMKLRSLALAKQVVLSVDNLSFTVDSVVFFQVTDAITAVLKTAEYVKSLDALSRASLRDVIGQSTLQECLDNRAELAFRITECLDPIVTKLGVKVVGLQIEDLIIPKDTVSMLAAVPLAQREAQAKLITARADVEAAKMMREAADTLNTDAAMQIRLLETLSKLAHSPNTKVLFLPTNIMGSANDPIKQDIATTTISTIAANCAKE